MSRHRELALPAALSVALSAGCIPIESSSATASETTTETDSTGSTETAETTSSDSTSTDTAPTTTTDTPETTTSTTTTSTTTTMPFVDPCPEDPTPDMITEEHAVFARADAEYPGEGTREKPFSSLELAVDAATAANKKVYACAEGVFDDVVLEAPIEIRGGFDCAQGWVYDPEARSSVIADPWSAAMTLTAAAGGAHVVGWHLEAPDAVWPGGGAVAMAIGLVEEPTFVCRCDLVAGNAQSGLDGKSWAGAPPAASGAAAVPPGQPGGATDACVDPGIAKGGAPGVTVCDVGISAGGTGGIPGYPPAGSGGYGGDGQPAIDNFGGKGGQGGGPALCSGGLQGKSASTVENGAGGKLKPELSLTGLIAHDGQPGKPGQNGQGGGGGGGAGYSLYCGVFGDPLGVGAGGGGGGAGGCGGKAGGAGTAGGSSIGLVSLGGEIFLKTVTITAGNGGNGGNGGDGQLGGTGGQGAPGGAKAQGSPGALGCAGAAGGGGSKGGWGGGGQGGDSVAIAFSEVDGVVLVEDTTYSIGVAGKGGNANNGAPAETKGWSGNAEPVRTYVRAP